MTERDSITYIFGDDLADKLDLSETEGVKIIDSATKIKVNPDESFQLIVDLEKGTYLYSFLLEIKQINENIRIITVSDEIPNDRNYLQITDFILLNPVPPIVLRNTIDLIRKGEYTGNVEYMLKQRDYLINVQNALTRFPVAVHREEAMDQLQQIVLIMQELRNQILNYPLYKTTDNQHKAKPGKNSVRKLHDFIYESQKRFLNTPQEDEIVNQFEFVKISCPVCNTEFRGKEVLKKAYQLVMVHEDYYPEYRGINPLHYEIIVCPKCFLALRCSDFGNIHGKLREKLLKSRDERRELMHKRTMNNIRTIKDVLLSYELAFSSYKHFGSQGNLGDLFLKASWVCREYGESKKEIEYEKNACECLIKAEKYEKVVGEQGAKQKLLFLIGFILFKHKHLSQAVKYFERAKNSGSIKDPLLRQKIDEKMEFLQKNYSNLLSSDYPVHVNNQEEKTIVAPVEEEKIVMETILNTPVLKPKKPKKMEDFEL